MSSLDIQDFLPKYPNITQSEHDVLNPYEENFYKAIFKKKEFYENKLERSEIFPKEAGMLTKHQKTIARYMSSHSPYDRVLLVHEMGTGKSCSAIGAIEQIKNEENTFTGALILAKGNPILDNFTREIVEKCTSGYYIPENYNKLTELEKIHRVKKKIKFYDLRTFIKFKKIIKHMSESELIEHYSNKIIVVDEVHNLRIQQEDQEETMDTYEEYYRFFHTVKNCKIILLSGTPMKDRPDEIASVANLILPIEEKLPTGQDFIEEYMLNKGNGYILNPEKRKNLSTKLKGKVSFLREAYSTVTKEYIGNSNFGNLKHFIVSPNKMSEFQSKYYAKAFERDKGGKAGVYINSREASLFVYPDGSYGKAGFLKYITVTDKKSILKSREGSVLNFKMTKELHDSLKGEDDTETLKNIRQYSATYADVIENILKTKGNCFIYSSLAQGSGCILFSLLLTLFRFSRATGKDKEKGLRYAILTNLTTNSTDIRRISNRFNRKDNMHGDYIKVIIGSRAVAEGYSFKNVIFEAVNTPHWNYSETAQALARGIRLGSHNDLLSAGLSPIINILQPVSMPREKYNVKSIDLLQYETSEDKDISIRSILRFLMEISFDCALNYFRNNVKGVDGSRDCDYTTCAYKCEGINMDLIKKGLEESEIDYSTYQLYYANPKIPLIRRKIESLFRVNNLLDLDSIVNNLKTEFTEDEIKNALYTIQEETESTEFDYKKFLEIYSRTPVKKIMNRIEEMFRQYFRLDLNTILSENKDYTEFEVLTALRTLINENIVIINKYGLPSYIREDNDMFFLVNNLSVNSTFFSEYYTKYPHIISGKTFPEIMESVYESTLPNLIQSICETEDEKTFSKLMYTLPLEVQEKFIEASLIAKEKKIKESKDIQNRVLDYFKNYIKNIDGTWISTFLKESKDILRCKKADKNEEWEDCDNKYNELLDVQEQERQEKLRENNPYGIMGTYNPTTGAFCIVDFMKEKDIIEKRRKTDTDKRLSHTGKVCGAGGWKLTELISIVSKRLKIPAPKDFREGDTREELIEKIKEDKKISEIFTKKELEKASERVLRSALYWSLPKKEGGNKGIKPICEKLKNWFEKNNLLEVDDKCGVQGKKKIVMLEKESNKNFIVSQFIPIKNEEFKEHIKDISKLTGECFNEKRYKPAIDDNIWILVFSKKKLVGFIVVNKNNVIQRACVAKNYRRQNIAKEAMSIAVKRIKSIGDKTPSLIVDNRDKNSKKLIRMYKSFGFEIKKADDKNTYMEHN